MTGGELLVVASTEIQNNLPIGLMYFKAVDAMVDSVQIKRNEYFDIIVYGPKETQPALKILRIQHNYQDGNIGKQDEIALVEKENRLQFNAECTETGEYISFPQQLNLTAMDYLDKTVATFKTLAEVDGSQIVINNQRRLVSQNGIWVQVDDSIGKKPTGLAGPPKQLDAKNDSKLFPGAKTEISTGVLLSYLLGLKKRKANSEGMG